MNMSIRILASFLALFSSGFEISAAEKPKDLEKMYSSFCLPPFGQFEETEKLKNLIASDGCLMYVENLKKAGFSPFFCGEKEFSFRIMLGLGGFTPTGIQFYEQNKEVFLRISSLNYVEKDCVDVKGIGGNFIYKLSDKEKKELKEKIEKSGFWGMSWLEKEKRGSSGKWIDEETKRSGHGMPQSANKEVTPCPRVYCITGLV